MTDPHSFAARTPGHDLPLLFAGQAQKEFFVNEALARIDALLHPVVEGTASSPPADPVDGEAWLVGADAAGAWTDRTGSIACWSAGAWLFVPAREGLTAYDRTARCYRTHRDGWIVPGAIAEPIGGETVDDEARAAIGAVLRALRASGLLRE